MARARANVTQAAIARVLKGAENAGLKVHGYRVGQDGSIEVLTGAPLPSSGLASDPETIFRERMAARPWVKSN